MAFQFKICCILFSSNNLRFLSSDSTTVYHISLHICRSGNFPQILTTNRPKYKILSFTYKLPNTSHSQPSCFNNLISLQPSHCTRSSSLVTLARPPTCSTLKITDCSFWNASPHLWNQLAGSFRQPRPRRSLPDSSLHHSHISSPLSSPFSPPITPYFIAGSKHPFFTIFFLHRPWTTLMYNRTADWTFLPSCSFIFNGH